MRPGGRLPGRRHRGRRAGRCVRQRGAPRCPPPLPERKRHRRRSRLRRRAAVADRRARDPGPLHGRRHARPGAVRGGGRRRHRSRPPAPPPRARAHLRRDGGSPVARGSRGGGHPPRGDVERPGPPEPAIAPVRVRDGRLLQGGTQRRSPGHAAPDLPHVRAASHERVAARPDRADRAPYAPSGRRDRAAQAGREGAARVAGRAAPCPGRRAREPAGAARLRRQRGRGDGVARPGGHHPVGQPRPARPPGLHA